jgi:ubiquinone/menaquinone biosynthesis C-methylase UbiE
LESDLINKGSDRVPVFDLIRWRDPISHARLSPIVTARTPAGVPICGVLRIEGTDRGYPIVDCVARLTPELAHRYHSWLSQLGLSPPDTDLTGSAFQTESTVESFGWQWAWNSWMRSEADLRMRVADKFGVTPEYFAGKLVADMGAGAGDQSSYLLQSGAAVVSVDLSSAIDVVAGKLRMHSAWFGVQSDITALPMDDDQFDCAYCEGVIQHTRDSSLTVRELSRVVRPGGDVLASHYLREEPTSIWGRVKRKVSREIYEMARARLSRLERYKLLLATGNLAALSYVPLLRALIRKTGLALYYDLMPDFKTTWTNTYDYYGSHAYQRFLSSEEFSALFRAVPRMTIAFERVGNIRASKSRLTADNTGTTPMPEGSG